VSLTFEEKLDNLAELAIKVGVGLKPGQRLMIRAPIESAPFVRKLTEKAYQTGARLVDVVWHDDALTLARFKYAPRDSFQEFPVWRVEGMLDIVNNGDASLFVDGKDPDLLKEQDPDLVALAEKVNRTHALPVSKQIMRDAANWLVIAQPVPAWAAKIFPDTPPAQQIDKLWEVIFQVCRADQPDPVAAWQEHLARLAVKRDILNQKQFSALRFTGPGTDLTVGLPVNHIWHGGQKETLAGIPFVPNLPTEEVFTMPHNHRVDGVVTSTKPLSYNGVLIDNFSLTFRQGEVVDITAQTGEATLKRLVEMDEGSSRLGEVALVPDNSPISRSGLLFYNTLFDENAASHIALGRAYRFCVQDGPAMSDEAFAATGGNTSLAHVDFMIGSAAVEVDGLTNDNNAQPLLRGGEWVI
jgi:aminopeptidase